MSEEITIGLITILAGAYAAAGEDGQRGFEVALAEFGHEVAGKRIKYKVSGTIGLPTIAQNAAVKLIDEGVDFIVGPLSGNEGLAIRNYAHEVPDHTFINGVSAARELTLVNAAPNFFNFTTTGAQHSYGLGTYAYNEMGYRRVVTIAENYSYPFGVIGAFTLEFCRLGGQIANKFWVSLMTNDYSEIIQAIDPEVDAIFCALGGTDAIAFLKEYRKSGQNIPILTGPITGDQTILSDPSVDANDLVGSITCGMSADDLETPAYTQFLQRYQTVSGALNYPSLFSGGYYISTKAALLALQAVDGDLSDGQVRFKQALSDLQFEGPYGSVRLDHNRQSVSTTFISEIARDDAGNLYRRTLKAQPNTDQLLGMSEEACIALGNFSEDNPAC